MNPSSWLVLKRRVRFGDTDAAGVLHFPRLLHWCHEAYEESLERFGIAAETLFPTPGHHLAVSVPVVRCSAEFLSPLVCGNLLAIDLSPQRLDPTSFEVRYTFRADEHVAATALSRHVAIDSAERRRCGLPEPLNRWLEASSLGAMQPL